MHIHVIGAGVVGLTTAYYLVQKGHQVTVIEQEAGVAKGASYANGGQLSYCLSDPLGKPSLFYKFPSVVLGRDPAIKFSPPKNLQSMKWLYKFLFECSKTRHKKNSLDLLELSLLSKSLLKDMLLNIELDFSHKKSSKIVLYEDLTAFEKEISFFPEKNKLGSDNKQLSIEDATRIEPSIESIKGNFVGAIYSKSDEVGDTYLFCKSLYAWLLEQNTSFLFNAKVAKLNTHKNKVSSLTINSEQLDVENIVICAGAMTESLVKISLPIIPVKGYSLTLSKGELNFSKSITLADKRMLLTRLGDRVRITGFADFFSKDSSQEEERISQLFSLAKDMAPQLADFNATELEKWAGVRPLTPSSIPIIGPSNNKGIYINSGQGFYGWTLACASGFRLAEFFK